MAQPTRKEVLAAIKAGDVIYGISGGGQEKLLFVYRTTPQTIFARHVTTQTRVEFHRDGQSKWREGGGSCTIVSAAPLPADQHAVVVGLDRKMRTAVELTDMRLSKAEILLLATKDEFYRSHPLPKG